MKERVRVTSNDKVSQCEVIRANSLPLIVNTPFGEGKVPQALEWDIGEEGFGVGGLPHQCMT